MVCHKSFGDYSFFASLIRLALQKAESFYTFLLIASNVAQNV